jgi:hypothetical protein
MPGGPDVGIEAVGFHYASSLLHKVQMATLLETDTPEILNQIITAVRKQGRISVVGVYVGLCNQFNMGAFMEKGLSMRGGQTPVQRYWKELLAMVGLPAASVVAVCHWLAGELFLSIGAACWLVGLGSSRSVLLASLLTFSDSIVDRQHCRLWSIPFGSIVTCSSVGRTTGGSDTCWLWCCARWRRGSWRPRW